MIEIVGAPFDLCGSRLGARLGPAAIRLAGLEGALRDLSLDVADRGDVPTQTPETADGGMRNFGPLLTCIQALRDQVLEVLRRGGTPLVLGGEHTLAVGGVSAALEVFEGDVTLLWIDAHADVNTPGRSRSGNIHGMPIAALQGLTSESHGQVDEEWGTLLTALGPQRVKTDHVVWYALRDVDPGERDRLRGLALTMHDIDRHGVPATIKRLDAYLREVGTRHLWVSFDVDALDPILAPGTGTAVRGGLSYREAHLSAELLREALDAPDCPYRLVGVDLVETNPLYDTLNSTAVMAVEWIASLFGKTILGRQEDRL